MSNPFDDVRAIISSVEARTAARLAELEKINDYLTDENRKLWATLHAYQDAETAKEEDRQG